MDFPKLLPRYVAAPVDDDRHHGLIVADSLSSAPKVVSGLTISGLTFPMIAIVDGSGNQITTFGSASITSLIGVTTKGQATMANSLPVVMASDQSTLPVAGAKTNNNAAPGATNVGALVGIANAAAPTWTEGDQVLESMDLSGNQRTTMGTLIAGENQTTNRLNNEPIYSFQTITTQTTTVVKSGAGTLHTLVISTPVASATVKVYDNTAASGTIILDTITLPATLISDGPITIGPLDASFSTGLTVVTAGATMSVSVFYR